MLRQAWKLDIKRRDNTNSISLVRKNLKYNNQIITRMYSVCFKKNNINYNNFMLRQSQTERQAKTEKEKKRGKDRAII